MKRIFETPRPTMICRLGFLLAAILTCTFMVASAPPTRAATSDIWLLQRDLAGLDYLPMNGIDGIAGPNTAASTRAFQSDNALQVDGIAGPQTMTALMNKVQEVQGSAGTYADGDYGQNTRAAVANYQSKHGLQVDGIAGPQTMAAMGIARTVSSATSSPPVTSAPSSPNQNRVQSSGTPLPTITARSPGSEQSFCTGAAKQTDWFGPENVRQIDHEVPTPVPPNLIAGYSVGDFNAPCIMPKVGVVRLEAFIQTKEAFGYFYGNNRTFNPEFDPADTKASIILDFTKGNAQVIVSPTCHASHTFITTQGVNATFKPDCAHANPLNGKNGLLVNWFHWKVDPAIPGFPQGTEFLTIQYAFKIATARASWWKWFGQHGIPPINGLIHFAFEPDTGNVCLKGTIDDFPATAIHQVHYDSSSKATAITLARHQEARLLGPIGLTDPFHSTETHIGNQCGQSLTGS